MRSLIGSLVGVGVLAGCLAACSSPSHSAARAAPVVPWTDAVPTAVQVRSAGPAAPCLASELRVVGKGFRFDPALAGGAGTVTLRNGGTHACRLTGRPTVRLVGAPRAPQQRQVPAAADAPSFPTIVPPTSTLLALPPGGTAVLGVDWRNWCVPGAGSSPKPLTPPRAVRVTLPGNQGSLDIGYDAVPACDSPGQPSTLGVRPFVPAALAATTPWTGAPLKAAIVDAKPARRGDTASFAVRLTNASTAAVGFDRCPLFAQELAPAGSPQAHQLNCAAVQPIPPGGSATFEMRIAVPQNAPLGNNGLFWELDPTGAGGPEVVSGLSITR